MKFEDDLNEKRFFITSIVSVKSKEDLYNLLDFCKNPGLMHVVYGLTPRSSTHYINHSMVGSFKDVNNLTLIWEEFAKQSGVSILSSTIEYNGTRRVATK